MQLIEIESQVEYLQHCSFVLRFEIGAKDFTAANQLQNEIRERRIQQTG